MDKAVGILSLLAEDGPASLAGVVEGTGLSRPTAYRLLSALETHGLVARDAGRYALGLKLLGWGGGAAGSDLISVATPVLAGRRPTQTMRPRGGSTPSASRGTKG